MYNGKLTSIEQQLVNSDVYLEKKIYEKLKNANTFLQQFSSMRAGMPMTEGVLSTQLGFWDWVKNIKKDSRSDCLF